jgi:hypothetical protein
MGRLKEYTSIRRSSPKASANVDGEALQFVKLISGDESRELPVAGTPSLIPPTSLPHCLAPRASQGIPGRRVEATHRRLSDRPDASSQCAEVSRSSPAAPRTEITLRNAAHINGPNPMSARHFPGQRQRRRQRRRQDRARPRQRALAHRTHQRASRASQPAASKLVNFVFMLRRTPTEHEAQERRRCDRLLCVARLLSA